MEGFQGKMNGKIKGLIYCMVSKYQKSLHWFLNSSPDTTGINPLVRLNHIVLNSPTMESDQINSNYRCNNKVETILYMDNTKDNRGTRKFTSIVKCFGV